MRLETALQAIAATKDVGALLCVVMILFVTPRVLKTFREMAQAFREEMTAERAAHRDETKGLTTAIHDLASETRSQTAELSGQSEDIRAQTAAIRGVHERITEAVATARSQR